MHSTLTIIVMAIQFLYCIVAAIAVGYFFARKQWFKTLGKSIDQTHDLIHDLNVADTDKEEKMGIIAGRIQIVDELMGRIK